MALRGPPPPAGPACQYRLHQRLATVGGPILTFSSTDRLVFLEIALAAPAQFGGSSVSGVLQASALLARVMKVEVEAVARVARLVLELADKSTRREICNGRCKEAALSYNVIEKRSQAGAGGWCHVDGGSPAVERYNIQEQASN